MCRVCFVARAPVAVHCAVSVHCFFATSAFGFRAPRLRGCVPGAACACSWRAALEAGAKRQGSWIACSCCCWGVIDENLVIRPDNSPSPPTALAHPFGYCDDGGSRGPRVLASRASFSTTAPHIQGLALGLGVSFRHESANRGATAALQTRVPATFIGGDPAGRDVRRHSRTLAQPSADALTSRALRTRGPAHVGPRALHRAAETAAHTDGRQAP